MSTRAVPRERLDQWLVTHGLAATRERAQALILSGRVHLEGVAVPKAGTSVRPGASVRVDPGPEHVGRGALKLRGALAAFGLDPCGRVALDVGASTGGFTEVLLAAGAARVYAVDVGHGQLHERLRADARVLVRERVNARRLSPADVPEACSLACVDVSFISLALILPPLRGVLAPGADVLALVKPQFEVGRRQVGRGGLVKDPRLHRSALEAVAACAVEACGYALLAACASPIAGSEGNREFFLHLRHGGLGLNEAARARLLERVAAAALAAPGPAVEPTARETA